MALNNKADMRQHKVVTKCNVLQTTICRTLKKNGVMYRRRKTVPKGRPGQKERQKTRSFATGLDADITVEEQAYTDLGVSNFSEGKLSV